MADAAVAAREDFAAPIQLSSSAKSQLLPHRLYVQITANESFHWQLRSRMH